MGSVPPAGTLVAEGTFTLMGKHLCARFIDIRTPEARAFYLPRLTPRPDKLYGTVLVIVFHCDHAKPPGLSLSKDNILFYFSLKSSNPDIDFRLGIASTIELYDFARNKTHNGNGAKTTKGAMPILFKFLKDILPQVKTSRFSLTNPRGTHLWLGTIEPRLRDAYSRVGFTQFGDNHTVSPFGTSFPNPGWSFLLPLTGPMPPSVGRLLVAAETVENELSNLKLIDPRTRPIKVNIDIPAATVQYIHEKLVLEGKAENALVFASQIGIGRAVDTDIKWNGTEFLGSPSEFKAVETPLPPGGDPTKTHVSLSAAVFSEHLAKNVTGHTHPVVLYMIMGERAKQDISPPSEQDLKLVFYRQSPLHLVWSPECVYSIHINPDLAGDPTITAECIAQLSSTEESRAHISRLCFLEIDVVEPIIDGFYRADHELQANIPRVRPPAFDPETALDHPSYLAYKKFKIELACHLYTNSAVVVRGATRLNILRIMPHYYTTSGNAVMGLNPQPSCITFTPFTLLTTSLSLSTAEVETAKAAAVVAPMHVASTERLLGNIITIGKGRFKRCPDGKCPPLPPSGVTFKFLDSNGVEVQGTFPVGETLYTILLSAIDRLPAAGAGAAAAAGAGAGVAAAPKITVTPPAIEHLYSRSSDGMILRIRSLVLEGNQSSGRITSNAIKEDGSLLTSTIEYHSRLDDGSVKLFTPHIEAFLKGITVHTTPRGGGYKRRSRRRLARRSRTRKA